MDRSCGVPLTFQDVAKTFKNDGSTLEAIRDISLSVPAGSCVSVLGPSGCGKSTLLRIAAGLESVSRGQVLIGDKTPDVFRRTGGLGVAFQDPALLPWRSVRDNVRLPLEVLRRKDPTGHVGSLVEKVNLGDMADIRPGQLSGGMRERVSLARALVSQPSLLLLDEPFRSLDESTRIKMAFLVQDVWMEHHPTIVMVTHSIDDALVLSDQIVLLSRRPACRREGWAVPFDRPRTLETLRSSDLAALRSEILRQVMED